jgi:DNA-binding transcriptional ArsR family regulator
MFGIMDHMVAVGALGALAQDSRLAIFRLLVKRGPEGHAAGDIGERLGIPGPTLSFHLRTLAQAGLVTPRREGRFIHYVAAFARMNALVAYLTENCCGRDSACAPACAPQAPAPASRRRRESRRRRA